MRDSIMDRYYIIRESKKKPPLKAALLFVL